MCECDSCGKNGYFFIDSNKVLCDDCYNDTQLRRRAEQDRNYNDDYCFCADCNGEV